jgi:hypothetical protein
MSDKSPYTYIYLFTKDGYSWDQQVIYLHLDQAINASCKNTQGRVEIFVTNFLYPGYMNLYTNIIKEVFYTKMENQFL